jgi:rhodanese-related sulfurtransferase
MKANFTFCYLAASLLILVLLPRCNRDSVVQNVSPAEAEKIIQANMNNTAFVILDVRTPAEFSAGHLAGAINIDFNADDFETKAGQLDKNKNYLVYCRTGHRSSGAVAMMKQNGFKSLKNMDGGISEWISRNLPVISE